MEEKEKELWEQYNKDRSIINRNALVNYYHEYVNFIAYKTSLKIPIEQDDCYQYAIFGLMQAIDRYDHTKNDNFKAFANQRTKGAILDGYVKEFKLKSNYKATFVSYNSLVDDDKNNWDEDHLDCMISEEYDQTEYKDLLKFICGRMSGREVYIVYLRIIKEKTFDEIAEIIGLAQSRICQLWKSNILPVLQTRYKCA